MKKKFFEIAAVVSLMHALRGTGCGVCGDASEKEKPVYLADGEKIVNSGINGVIAKHCSVTFADINDPAEWELYATDPAPLLLGRGGVCSKVRGTKPLGTPTYQVVGACGTEDVVSTTRTFTLTDSGNDELLSVDDFWCFLLECADEYEVAFTTCDGRMYPFQSAIKFFADTVETNSNDDPRVWEATWDFKTPGRSCLRQLIPPGLNDNWGLLQGGTTAKKVAPFVKKQKAARGIKDNPATS